ncbi:type IV secretory system conjugative DNA transfer family protein [Teichococcus rhizosphaerae]|nr:type IV secretory system conjugative DNA transfer family protein [Pseudoroseomonas rhizosphaerae]
MAPLLLGRRLVRSRPPIGFRHATTVSPGTEPDAIAYHGDAPLITFAATGGGKTSGPVICTACAYPGQFICLDVKGEAYRLSAEHRRARGQDVHLIDLSDGKIDGDCLNPLDMAVMLGDAVAAVARSIAAEMVERPTSLNRDFFWIDWSETMLAVGSAYQLT